MPVEQPGEGEPEWPDLSPAVNVGPTSPDPAASSPQAPPVLESQPGTGEALPEQPEDERAAEEGTSEEPLPEFDPRYRDDLEGLMFLGKLERDFRFAGHKFVIRTLTTDEILEVGLLHKPYISTLGELRAYQSLTTAACIVSVDGKKLPLPITDDDDDTRLRNAFIYVKDHWFPPVIDAIYNEFLVLEEIVARMVVKMGEAQG